MLLHDEVIKFVGCWPTISSCRVRVYASSPEEYQEIYQRGPRDDDDRRIYFLLTQSGFDSGVSITSSCDIVAARASEHFGIHPARIVVIQHYDYRATLADGSYLTDLETFSRIDFDRSTSYPSSGDGLPCFGSPIWSELQKEDVLQLVGQSLD